MDHILECTDQALQQGCNSSLGEMMASTKYHKLSRLYSDLPEQFPVESIEGTALRAGHLLMGRLFNTLAEPDALAAAREKLPAEQPRLDLHPIIESLGESIIEAAKHCLPQEAIDLALEWQTADVERQIEIGGQMYRTFRSTKQKSKGFLTTGTVWEKFLEKLHEQWGIEDVLPALYGSWDEETCTANCQGKTQMLVAFARLAQTRALCANPLRLWHEGFNRAMRRMRDIVMQDLEERHLADGDESFFESLKATYMEEDMIDELYFHVACALELRDGRWILIDPHGLSWGVFSDEWNIPVTCKFLEKYRYVLPGLQLIRHDHGEAERKLAERVEEGKRILDLSRRMEQRINEANIQTITDLIDLISEQDDLELLLRYDAEEKGRELSVPLESREMRQYVATMIVVGQNDMFDLSKMMDPQFIKSRIRSWLTYYHCTAMNLFRNQLSEAGELLHPVCEFGRPTHHLALSALNTLLQAANKHNSMANRFFLDHGFDQTSLHNALGERSRHGDYALGQAAAETLAALPFRHTICDQCLQHIVQRR